MELNNYYDSSSAIDEILNHKVDGLVQEQCNVISNTLTHHCVKFIMLIHHELSI